MRPSRLIRAIGVSTVLAAVAFGVPQPPDLPPADGSGLQQPGLEQPGRRNRGPGQPGDAGPPTPAQPPTDAEPKAGPPPPPKPDRYFALTNAEVYPVSGPVLRGVTVLCKNGRIEAIAARVPIPEGAEVLDVAGHRVYPGLVAVRSQGILGEGSPDDSSDLFAFNLTAGLAGGLTTVLADNTAAKLTRGSIDGLVVKRNVFETIRYDSADPAGRHRLRASLDRLRRHLREVADHEEAKRRDPSASAPDDKWITGDYARHLRLLKGEAVGLADADGAYDLLQLAGLADEYGLRLVARGAVEGWTVPTALSRARVMAIVSARARVEADERTIRPTGSNVENAAILARHGVTVAITPAGSLFGPGYGISFGGLGGRDLLNLPMEAAFAVRGGLTNDEAVRTITLDAARVLGVDDRVGSIDVGKDADFAITDGDLLHYMTHVRWTVVNGRVEYDKADEGLLSHITPGRDGPPPTDYWPRRLGDPIPEPPRPSGPKAEPEKSDPAKTGPEETGPEETGPEKAGSEASRPDRP